MTREKEREIRKIYIERVLRLALKPKEGFESIQYAIHRKTDAEYIRIKDKRGTSITFDITGESLEEVMLDIFKITIIGEKGKHERIEAPANIIRNRNELLKLAPLFE